MSRYSKLFTLSQFFGRDTIALTYKSSEVFQESTTKRQFVKEGRGRGPLVIGQKK